MSHFQKFTKKQNLSTFIIKNNEKLHILFIQNDKCIKVHIFVCKKTCTGRDFIKFSIKGTEIRKSSGNVTLSNKRNACVTFVKEVLYALPFPFYIQNLPPILKITLLL